MKINVGDTVQVLDDTLEGTVVLVENDEVTFEDAHGFEMTFHQSELVVISNTTDEIETLSVPVSKILKENNADIKKKSTRTLPKDRNKAKRVIDLHLHKLVSNEKGLSNFDKLNIQLDEAKRQLDFAIQQRLQKIVFVHGVGQGVLKAELETMCRRYDNVKFYDADFKEYGFGATEVYIFQNS